MTKDYTIHNVIGDISKGVTTRHFLNKVCNSEAFDSQINLEGIEKAIIDEHWSLMFKNS